MKLSFKELPLIYYIVVYLEFAVPVVPALLVLALVRVVDVCGHVN